MKNIVRAVHWLFSDPQAEQQIAGLTAFQSTATQTLKEHAMKLSELTAHLQSVDAQLTKAKAEITAKLDELAAALADVDVPPAASEAMAALSATAQGLDDIVPDAPAGAEAITT